ncbi:FecR domain-containing protein [Azonexus sp.]|uniref:FecR family protein n=1 Tax=Azonexus sp. TaxID=1872668 RepID=UPI0027BAD0B5|nr:FecR domain-containing protein [Azonexus sp.]
MAARSFETSIAALLACLGLMLGAGAATAAQEPQEIVGQITTVIGQGAIRNPAGALQSVARGDRIRAGDQIETAAGGHVHIRFVDGGLVSVRPLSRLLIESYTNGGANTQAAIKFRLEEGVVRSVTGEWGEASRDRFRLNTPIAAIGVKGTDFIVKVEGGNTFASVISGAIVMAPLAGGCASTLGPCLTDQAATLNADMSGQMLEYLQKNGSGAPRLVPAVDLLARNGIADALAESRRGEVSTVDARDKMRTSDSQASNVLDEGRVNARTLPLIWLHNTMGWNVSENTISERYDEALQAGRTLVASNFFVSLYRDESQLKTFQPIGSQANFQLSSYSATFTQPIAYDRPSENVQISNASLQADFARSTFTTGMTLKSPSLGEDNFKASGTITDRGLLVSSSAGQTVAGAFSTDGLQAGYSFEKQLSNGTVNGLTLWGR